MSFLIGSIDSYILEKVPSSSQLRENWKEGKHFKRIEKEEIKKTLQKIVGSQNHKSLEIEWSQTKIIIHLLFITTFRNLAFVLRMTIDQYSRQLHITYKLLNNHQSYTVVNSNQRRIFTAKILIFFHKRLPEFFNQFKIYIDTSIGSISIEHPTFFKIDPNLDCLGSILSFFTRSFFKGLQQAFQPLLSLIQLSNENLCAYQKDLISISGGTRLKKIKKYSNLSSIILNLGVEETHQERSLKQKMFLQGKSLKFLNQNLINVEDQFKSKSLFCLKEEQQEDIGKFSENDDRGEFTLNKFEKMQIKGKLQLPQTNMMIEKSERSFVVNHIKLVHKINEQRLKKITTGGFSNIYLAEVIYYPISSHSITKQQSSICFSNKQIKKKTFILKKQTINSFRQIRSRLKHQKNILGIIKSALSTFIPKYFFIYKPTQQQQHYLIMQHIYLHNNSFSLEDYVKRFKKSLSQQTIVYFALMIVQGLRYLRDYQIVHLDIKQGNIMIGKKLSIKIIDFGESYHPSLKNHRPGVSMPYSPPQSYKIGQNFNSKSDVYSFGVLLYYLLTSRYPFFIYEEKERQLVYRQDLISERWFYSPEGLADYGQTNVFPYLMKIIGRCLEPNPHNRPELQWISLILREYLQYFR